MREMTHFNYAHIKEEMKQIVKKLARIANDENLSNR